MKKQYRFSIWYAIIGMWAVLFLHNMIVASLGVKNIPYSEFVKAVKEGRVTEIAISENDIRGRIVDAQNKEDSGALFRTVRVDPDIATLLDENNVTYSGRLETNFLGTVLSWLIPIANPTDSYLRSLRNARNQFENSKEWFMTI